LSEIIELNRMTEGIIGAAIRVHKELGPGLLESAYETCLVYELRDQGFFVEVQKPIPVVYRNQHLDCGYRLDLLVNETVVVEVKSVDTLNPIHEAQILTYLKLSNHPLGLLINFNVKLLKQGIRRLVNGPLP